MAAADFFNLSMSEDKFMRNIIAHAVARGWGEPIDRKMTRKEKAEKMRPYHVTIAKKGASGFPDLVMVRDGRQLMAELKREKGGRTSVAQRKWLAAARSVQMAIAAAICSGRHALESLPCHMHREQAIRLYGVYEWRPSDWPEIEQVLA